MAKNRIVDLDKGFAKVVKKLQKKYLKLSIGIPAAVGSQLHKADDSKEKRLPTLLEVATWQEFGVPGRIPQRSFIREGFDEYYHDFQAQIINLMKGVTKDKVDEDKVLDILGLYAVGKLQKRMADGIAPQLAPSTVAHRQSPRNTDGSKTPTPLIDTGQLRSSITYVLKRR